MIYYAHSMRTYGTDKERRAIELLQKKFGEVYNPSCAEIQKARDPMSACLEKIASDEIDALAFSFHEGHVGRGVFDEVNCALAFGKPVYVVRRDTIERFQGQLEIVDPQDWRVCYAKAA